MNKRRYLYMKKTISNFELENYIRTLSAPESFKNNMHIKLPGSLVFAVRVNLKAMIERYSVVEEMIKELRDEFTTSEKVDGDNLKLEYVTEWNKRYNDLMIQTSELDLTPIKKEDFENRDDLSWPELDILFWMTEE